LISDFGDPRFGWRCEPKHWSLADGVLTIQPDAPTDFWCKTHYGFEADNGHFRYVRVGSDFRLSAEIVMTPRSQYDQAGLMVRVSKSCWLKTSIEYEPGCPNRLGAVVTNAGYSDWSTQDVAAWTHQFRLRVTRTGADYVVEASLDADKWTHLRTAHLHESGDPASEVACGVYACSPKAAGFRAEFRNLVILPST
jgi:regulation of enolase protein 1 (concanavalin A-like superfamily)